MRPLQASYYLIREENLYETHCLPLSHDSLRPFAGRGIYQIAQFKDPFKVFYTHEIARGIWASAADAARQIFERRDFRTQISRQRRSHSDLLLFSRHGRGRLHERICKEGSEDAENGIRDSQKTKRAIPRIKKNRMRCP